MTTKIRNEAKLQELATQVEALRNETNSPQVDYTLKRIGEWSERQLLARFVQIRRATLDAVLHGNPKYREANMQIVLVYEAVVTHLAPRAMKLAIYENRFWHTSELLYRGVCTDERVMYVDLDLIEREGSVPAPEVFSTAYWRPFADGEMIWIAEKCQECGHEFRLMDGYALHGPNLFYSYCADCYSDQEG